MPTTRTRGTCPIGASLRTRLGLCRISMAGTCAMEGSTARPGLFGCLPGWELLSCGDGGAAAVWGRKLLPERQRVLDELPGWDVEQHNQPHQRGRLHRLPARRLLRRRVDAGHALPERVLRRVDQPAGCHLLGRLQQGPLLPAGEHKRHGHALRGGPL